MCRSGCFLDGLFCSIHFSRKDSCSVLFCGGVTGTGGGGGGGGGGSGEAMLFCDEHTELNAQSIFKKSLERVAPSQLQTRTSRFPSQFCII